MAPGCGAACNFFHATTIGLRIAAVVEDQRTSVGMPVHQDFADEYDVIAGELPVRHATLKQCGVLGQQWNAGDAGGPFNAGEFVGSGAGKPFGQRLLVGSEHMHAEVACLFEGASRVCVFGQGPENQGRIEGNGIEAVRGYSDGFAIGAACGDNGDSRGKLSECPAEVFPVVGGQWCLDFRRTRRAPVRYLSKVVCSAGHVSAPRGLPAL